MEPKLSSYASEYNHAVKTETQQLINGQRKHTDNRKYVQFLFLLFAVLFSLKRLKAQDVLFGLTSNGGPEGKGTAYSIRSDTKAFTVIKGFADWGASPVSDLVRGSDGYLYGMSPNGGTYNHGTLFKISTGGDITVLKHFNLYAEGGYPNGSLIQANDGNFYGMLNSGPSGSTGVIFKITSGGKFTVVRNLSSADGGRPHGHLIQAADGHFYGVNTSFGQYGYGTIFRLTTGGQYTVLKSFNGTTDGANSYASLVQGNDGALYGMTKYGGAKGYGVVFRIETNGSYKVIRSLNPATDAGYPVGDLVQGKDGWLYGMAPTGVGYNGVAFKIKTDGSSLSVLHKMDPSTDGGNPYGSLMLSGDGNFYGMNTLISGGYAGTAFRMGYSGSLTVIKKFTRTTEGGGPSGNLIQTPDGAFYGMTNDGGKHGKGTIFKLVGSTLTVLSHLNGSAMGNEPQGNLAIGKDSAYFGTARAGGTYNNGTIYKICGGVTTVLKSFSSYADGSKPAGSLLRAKDGNLYGVAEEGGLYSSGTIFRYTSSGSFNVVRHLKAATDGGYPKGGLVQGADGYLYGTTYSGGANSGGTIFKIKTDGTGFTVLRPLAYATDGTGMLTGLTIGKDANFYGMTGNNTRFFRVTKDGAFSVIKTLAYSTDGTAPAGELILGTDGNFYGTTSSGGTYSAGVVFRIGADGTITRLRQLNPAADGGNPKGSLVRTSDGTLYGTTSTGGANKAGTIFKISGTTFNVLRHLNMATDGGTPLGGLILAPKITLAANPQSGLTTTEDVAKAITLTGSGSTNLTFNILIKPRHGSVSAGTTGARTYTPAANFYGVDSFAFTANLGCLASVPAWVKINVSLVNDAPVLATTGSKTVAKGTALKFIAVATDPDPGQTKTFSLITPPSGATISSSTGAFSWTPSATGTFTFKVRVTDNGSPALYDEETITVTVTATTLTAARTGTITNTEATDFNNTKSSIYPNPVINSFTINLKEATDETVVTIFDIKGAVVSTKKFGAAKQQQLKFDGSQLNPGQYLLQLRTSKGAEVLKFIKL